MLLKPVITGKLIEVLDSGSGIGSACSEIHGLRVDILTGLSNDIESRISLMKENPIQE
jgi:hypothetical protein